jgi:hypothetical protein
VILARSGDILQAAGVEIEGNTLRLTRKPRR